MASAEQSDGAEHGPIPDGLAPVRGRGGINGKTAANIKTAGPPRNHNTPPQQTLIYSSSVRQSTHHLYPPIFGGRNLSASSQCGVKNRPISHRCPFMQGPFLVEVYLCRFFEQRKV